MVEVRWFVKMEIRGMLWDSVSQHHYMIFSLKRSIGQKQYASNINIQISCLGNRLRYIERFRSLR